MATHFSRNVFSHIRIRFIHSSNHTLPTTSATSSSSYTVDFLVNSCGLPLKSALSVSNKFQLNHKTQQIPQSVLQFLKSHRFSDTHVARLIVKCPQVLNCRIHNNLKPKFEYLVKIGFEGELLPHIIVSNPSIARYSLASKIKPCVEFLRLFLDSDEKFLMAVKRAPWLLGSNSKLRLEQNVNVLMEEGGVPAHVVQRLITLQPRSIFQNPENLISAVNSVKDLGFEPTGTTFIHAFRVKIQMSDPTWIKKIDLMKSMGFSQEDILKAFKRFPHFLGLSEDNITKTLNFYFNTMKLEPQTLIVYAPILGYSIEKRVRPRYHVLKVLESKKLIKESNKLQPLKIGEKNFREKYIEKFIDEVPGLLEFYLGIKEAKIPVLDGEEQEEAQREVLNSSNETDISAMYSKNQADKQQICSACGGKNHSGDRCWTVVGYPRWHSKHKAKSKTNQSFTPGGQSSTSRWNAPKTAANVQSNVDSAGLLFSPQQLEQLMQLMPKLQQIQQQSRMVLNKIHTQH